MKLKEKEKVMKSLQTKVNELKKLILIRSTKGSTKDGEYSSARAETSIDMNKLDFLLN